MNSTYNRLAARSARGYTIFEITIACAMLSIVMLSVYGVLEAGYKTTDESMSVARSFQVANNVLQQISTDIQDGKVIFVSDNGATIRLQVPVDYDGDGDALGQDYKIEWGAVRQSNGVHKLGWFVEYRFIRRKWRHERMYDRDYNRDLDKQDGFMFGQIYRRVYRDDLRLVENYPITPIMYLQTWPYGEPIAPNVSGVMFSIVDDTGNPNPNGSRVFTNMFVCILDDDGYAHTAHLQSMDHMRNFENE